MTLVTTFVVITCIVSASSVRFSHFRTHGVHHNILRQVAESELLIFNPLGYFRFVL